MNKKEALKFAMSATLNGEPQAKIIQQIADRTTKKGNRIEAEVNAEYLLKEVWNRIDKKQKARKGKVLTVA